MPKCAVYKTKEASELKCVLLMFFIHFRQIYLKMERKFCCNLTWSDWRIEQEHKKVKKNQPNIIIIKHWWHLIAASIEQDPDNRKTYTKNSFILILSNVVNGSADWWCIGIIPMNIGWGCSICLQVVRKKSLQLQLEQQWYCDGEPLWKVTLQHHK